MSKDTNDKSVIVMIDPIVVDWKLRLIEKFFEKSTPIKSDKNNNSKEMNHKMVEQTTSQLEGEHRKVSAKKDTRIVELTEFNEYNYWKIDAVGQEKTEDHIDVEAKDVPHTQLNHEKIVSEANDEMPEYYDNNWWKQIHDIKNVKMEADNNNLEEKEDPIPAHDIEKVLMRKENDAEFLEVESDDAQECSMFNEFNWWKQGVSTIKIETNEDASAIKMKTNDFSAALKYPDVKTNGHEIKRKDEKLLKPKTCTNPQKLSTRRQSTKKREIKPKQICEAGDQNNNVPSTKENPMDSVVMVNNLDPAFLDCDRLFNLISPYAVVKRIKFVKKAQFQTALVELDNKAAAKRVTDYLNDTKVSGKKIKMETSSKLNFTELKPDLLLSLPKGSKAFKVYSQEKTKQYLHHHPDSMYPPSRTLHFYRTPKLTDEEFYKVFEELEAPVPYKVMWFPNMTGMGCLQFKSVEEALKAICIVNQAKTSGGRIHLAFTYGRWDYQFYSKK